MKSIRFLLASITMMLFAVVGFVGGGQGGGIIAYIAMPVSLILMMIGLLSDDAKNEKNVQNDKEDLKRNDLLNNVQNKKEDSKRNEFFNSDQPKH